MRKVESRLSSAARLDKTILSAPLVPIKYHGRKEMRDMDSIFKELLKFAFICFFFMIIK
jgi:hypothetical protein